MRNKGFILFIAIMAFVGLAVGTATKIYRGAGGDRVAVKPSATSAAARQAVADTSAMADIPLHDMVELDFKKKQEIYDLRKSLVAEHPDFAPANYAPNNGVFGQILDGKGWWGILGLTYYGPGPHGIDGLSEESRFLGNPYLLVGLDNGAAFIVDKDKPAIGVWPTPKELHWQKDGKLAVVRYDMSSFWKESDRIEAPRSFKNIMTLVSYNAQDFGFGFLYVAPENSENISIPPRVAQLGEYIHTGGSCGYPGGCNNMSPYLPDLEFRIDALPAFAYVKLWKKLPLDPSAPADMVFAIEMM